MADKNKQQFSNLQMVEIKQGIRHHVDTTIYQNVNLMAAQMREIRLGLEKGLEVSKYADMKFSAQQMEQIRLGLEQKLDVGKFISLNYSAEQMEQIRLGIKLGLDTKAFESPAMTAEQMKDIRLTMTTQKVLDKIRDQLKEILESLLRVTKLYVHFPSKEAETSLSPKISEILAQRSEEVIKEKIAEQEEHKEPESLEEVAEEISEAIKEPEVQEEIVDDKTLDQTQKMVDEESKEQSQGPQREEEQEEEQTIEGNGQGSRFHENPELNEAMGNYVQYRAESGHPLLKSQISATLAHVAFLEPDIHRQAEMLNQTVVNGWKSIYPLKEQNQGKAFTPQRTNYNQSSSKQNQFHNFDERDYDFDKLDKELLTKQWEPIGLSGAQKEPALDLEP